MKYKLSFVVLIVSMFILAACGSQSTPTNSSNGGTQPQNTVVSGGQAAAPMAVVLDPALASDATAKDAISHIYEGLVRLDNGEPAVALAADITISEDNLDYIFALRPGVKFHDGTPFNADAAIANFNRWFDPKDPLHGSGMYDAWAAAFGGFKGETTSDGKPKSNFDGIEKVNDLTVLVHLHAPDPDFLKKLTDPAFSIVSPAALKAAGFGTANGTDGGTGPYKIGKWSDTGLTLEPNSSYWNPAAVPGSNMEVKLGK